MVQKSRQRIRRTRVVVMVVCGALVFFLISLWAIVDIGNSFVYSVGRSESAGSDRYNEAMVEHFLETMRNARLKFD